MKLKQIMIAAALVLPVLDAAADMRDEEKRGAIGGLITGAAVGGPVGAGIGAIMGGGIFGKLVGLSRENRQLRSSGKRPMPMSAPAPAPVRTERSMDDMRKSVDKLLELQISALEIPLQFRTASSEIESIYEEPLQKLAAVLKKNRRATLVISGYADRRGDADYNQGLSQDRVDQVRSFLMSLGVNRRQVVEVIAYGETRPLEQMDNRETFFFDRRVVLDITVDRK
ncbi:MAG: OmpA family protein [Pseudomonadales bacterium]